MKKEMYEKLSVMSISVFGLAVALAWNNVIQTVFTKYYQQGQGITGMIFYAIAITGIAIFVTAYLAKTAKKVQKQNKKQGKHERELFRALNQL
ncbi:MAG: DUF5654 family protein [Candidatus Woesearchaeota archaeon]